MRLCLKCREGIQNCVKPLGCLGNLIIAGTDDVGGVDIGAVNQFVGTMGQHFFDAFGGIFQVELQAEHMAFVEKGLVGTGLVFRQMNGSRRE